MSPDASPTEPWKARHALWVVSLGVFASVLALAVVGRGGVTTVELFALVLPVQSVGTIVAAVVLARRRGGVRTMLALRFSWSDLVGLPIGAGIQVVTAAVALAIVETFFGGEMPGQEIVSAAADTRGLPIWILVVATLVVLGPLAEEIAFRGILLPSLLRRGDRFAVWTSGAWFAVLHLLDPNAAFVVPFLFVLAVVLGNERLRTGRLGRPVAIHAGFNLITVLALFANA